jgi:DNA-binding NtrC family response regulator
VFIAIVDDEPDLAHMFRDALKTIPGVIAVGFSDPQLALEHFRLNHERYACIISDYRMPAMTGLELFEKVSDINKHVPRILISAFEIHDELFKNCQVVTEFLQKPIKISNLIECVRKCLTPIELEKESLR